MTLPVSFMTLTFNDNTLKSNGQPETGSITVPITTISAGNFTAEDTLLSTLEAAIIVLAKGTEGKREIVSHRSVVDPDAAASPLAQRENKFLIRYHGVTLLQKFQCSIPTADLTALMTNSEFVDVAAGPGNDLKLAFEAVVVSPDNSSESVILDSIQFVGRNT